MAVDNKYWIYGVLILLLSGTMTSCNSDRDIRDYYFPVRALTDGKVYVYETLAGPDTLPVYWYALGIDQDTALYLSFMIYDGFLNPANLIKEEVQNAGMVTREVTLYATDTSGTSISSHAEVLAGNTFPFYLDAETRPAYVYKIKYIPPTSPGAEYTITYNRQFASDTTINVMGKDYPALRFDMQGETDINDPDNGSMSPAFSGYEIYAKGIGLVESYRDFDGFAFHNRLKAQISMQELEQLQRER